MKPINKYSNYINKNKNKNKNKSIKKTKIISYLLFLIKIITIFLFPISTNSLSNNLKSTVLTLTNSKTDSKHLKFNKNLNQNQNFNLNALNFSYQKPFLSKEDFIITKINSKFHKISTESIYFDEKNSCLYETGIMKDVNILLKKNYLNNKVIKAIPLPIENNNINFNGNNIGKRNLLNININIPKGFAKCGTNFYQFSGFGNKILRFSYPNLDILNPINIDYNMKNGEGLAELSDDFLIASNGTEFIFILDCKNELNVIKSFSVKNLNNEPLYGIKEMVYVGEYIYLLRENDNRIYKISLTTRKVLKIYNMLNLINFELKTKSLNKIEINKFSSVNLSGIGYDRKKKIFILTGKNWGHYYEVDLK
jgi:glutamine cyclotransferase